MIYFHLQFCTELEPVGSVKQYRATATFSFNQRLRKKNNSFPGGVETTFDLEICETKMIILYTFFKKYTIILISLFLIKTYQQNSNDTNFGVRSFI